MSKRPRGHSVSSSPSKDSISTYIAEGNATDTSTERAKYVVADTKALPEVMHCSLPPHRETLSFTSYEDYEVHYLQNHVNRCSECSKNFPVGHLLNVHIEENHDPLIAARRARGEKTVSFPKLWPPNCYTMTPTKTNYSMDALSRTASGSAPLLRNGVSI